MNFVADFHIHSKYARATSRDMDLESLAKWAKIKGIKVLGTGDFSHPEWFKSLQEKLIPAEAGLFKLKEQDNGTRFILTNEISCIYSKGGKVRKVHILIFAPSFKVVAEINFQLGRIGNIKSDGRPILGLDAKELAKIALNVSEDCLVIPAHIWTPWFSVFGSKSGFDSMEECFEDYTRYIYAAETGLSSDPAMNWRLSFLDKITLISNSDSHSPAKIGREANVFDAELSYNSIAQILKTKDSKKFLYTIEFFPEEGKYHYDGHRSCGVSLAPQESKKSGNICPVCGRPLTIGVLNRVEELADRPVFDPLTGKSPKGAIPFKSLVPLNEIVANAFGMLPGAKKVAKEYWRLIEQLGSEFNILLEASKSDLAKATLPEIAEGIIRVRQGKVFAKPGYDGVYGQIKIFSSQENKEITTRQKTLF
jgi:uncharacterized protein (TIGR00375 family)